MIGTVSIWYGRPGGPPRYARAEHAPHYAASMMKLAVLVALHRGVEAGRLALDEPVPVLNSFRSAAPGGGSYGCRRSYDSDLSVWARLGGSAPLGWLAQRMIAASSNLATNLVLARVGLAAVAEVWPLVGASGSVVARGIEDADAADAGLSNVVTAADLAALLGAVAAGTLPGSRAMLETLSAQEHRDDLVAGLPPGTHAAVKNGWVTGVRHAAGVIFPDDAEPYLLAVCTTTPWAVNGHPDRACRLVARISAAAWSARLGR